MDARKEKYYFQESRPWPKKQVKEKDRLVTWLQMWVSDEVKTEEKKHFFVHPLLTTQVKWVTNCITLVFYLLFRLAEQREREKHVLNWVAEVSFVEK